MIPKQSGHATEEQMPHRSPYHARVHVTSGFWRAYQRLNNERVIPYQWKALNDEIPDAPKSHSVENFRIAAGMSEGEYDGMVFQDSDLAKWIEAAGYAMENTSEDPEYPAEARQQLEGQVRDAVDAVAAAQQPDGYLNTYFTVKRPDARWANLRQAHELYVAGHMIEAGIAVFRGTGDRKLLDVVIRLADYIATVFGREPGKRRGYPGHQEIELALMKLYRTTGEHRFMELARYFIDERGRTPYYFDVEAASSDFVQIWNSPLVHDYQQSHVPVRDQRDAVGHSVRAMYQYVAMADIAIETGDAALADACRALWESTTERRMYVTGGIGSSSHGEQFTTDYDLPNDTAYAETCASIGLFIFAHRMATLDNDARYVDVAERALYNGVISGLSLDGERYFYVNPLAVDPRVCDTNGTHAHAKYRRQKWYGCACCPPNVARIIASLGDYAARAAGDTLYVDHFVGGTVSAELEVGGVEIEVAGDYPWDGSITLRVSRAPDAPASIAVRLPGWCDGPALSVNGERVDIAAVQKRGYALLSRQWRSGDRIALDLPMPVRTVCADPRVKADFGRIAVLRGPLCYCLEEADNGANLHAAAVATDPDYRIVRRDDLLGGVSVITCAGTTLAKDATEGPLYRSPATPPARTN
ncbi:MAG: glycoside hydrolase family 127 protein, partial [Spirochaetaceae bacterium]